jgi:hypothetical protein
VEFLESIDRGVDMVAGPKPRVDELAMALLMPIQAVWAKPKPAATWNFHYPADIPSSLLDSMHFAQRVVGCYPTPFVKSSGVFP